MDIESVFVEREDVQLSLAGLGQGLLVTSYWIRLCVSRISVRI